MKTTTTDLATQEISLKSNTDSEVDHQEEVQEVFEADSEGQWVEAEDHTLKINEATVLEMTLKDPSVLDITLATDNSEWTKLATNQSKSSTIVQQIRSRKRGMNESSNVIKETDPIVTEKKSIQDLKLENKN
jgi:hypothetical protein